MSVIVKMPIPIASIVAPITARDANAIGAGRCRTLLPDAAAPAIIPPAQHAVSTPKAVGPAASVTVIRNTNATSAIAVA